MSVAQEFDTSIRKAKTDRPQPSLEDLGRAEDALTPRPEEVAGPSLNQRVTDLSKLVLTYLEDVRNAALTARENIFAEYGGFDAKTKVERRRAKGIVKVTLTTTGEVNERQDDGFADLGLTNGWTMQGIHTAKAYFSEKLFRANRRPWVLQGMGSRDENATIERGLNDFLDLAVVEQGQLLKKSPRTTGQVLTHGTGFLRSEMGGGVTKVRTDKGFVDGPPTVQPVIRNWRYEDVLVTSPDRPDVSDQEGIFFISRNVTLPALRREEVVVGPNADGRLTVVGKFRHLQNVIDADARANATPTPNQSKDGNVSGFARRTLYEYEGDLPWLKWFRDGKVDVETMQYFGVVVPLNDVNRALKEPHPESGEEMESWARSLAAITMWNVAAVSGANESGATTEHESMEFLLRLEPARNRDLRSSLYKFTYIPDELNFYGIGIPMAGEMLEAAGDMILNAEIWGSYRLANPTYITATGGTENLSIEKIRDILNKPGEIFRIDAPRGKGVRIRDLVDRAPVDLDPNAEQRRESLKRGFEDTTMVGAAAKGSTGAAPDTGTLGEAQINEGKSASRLNEVIAGHGEEFARLIRDIVQDFLVFLGPAKLAEEIARVSGLGVSEVERVLPSVEGLDKELIIHHPIQGLADQTQLTAILAQLFKLTGGAAFEDVQKFAEIFLEKAGYPRPEDLLRDANFSEPEDEHQQMRGGNWKDPREGEPLAQHFVAHARRLQELAALVQSNPQAFVDDNRLLLEATLLETHTKATMDLMELQLQQLGVDLGVGGEAGGTAGPRGQRGQGPATSRARGGSGETTSGTQPSQGGGGGGGGGGAQRAPSGGQGAPRQQEQAAQTQAASTEGGS